MMRDTFVELNSFVDPSSSTSEKIASSKRGSSDTISSDDVSKKGGKRRKNVDHEFLVESVAIQDVKKPRTYMNHSYRDMSKVPPQPDDKVPEEINNMSFPQKVHHILSNEENSKFFCWKPHGRAFHCPSPRELEQTKTLQKYFGHNRYSSFLRQLSNHGFKHITKGEDRNCYYHEFVLRGLPHLTRYMPEAKDARRLIPDPDNEPNFYKIAKAFPLPDDPEGEMVAPYLKQLQDVGPDIETSSASNKITLHAQMTALANAKVIKNQTFSDFSPLLRPAMDASILIGLQAIPSAGITSRQNGMNAELIRLPHLQQMIGFTVQLHRH